MTRKDYVMIAETVRAAFDVGPLANTQLRDFLARLLADGMARDNPRFDRERFLRACGITA
jgi:hypothetical protein